MRTRGTRRGLSSVQMLSIFLALTLVFVGLAYVDTAYSNATAISTLQSELSALKRQSGTASSDGFVGTSAAGLAGLEAAASQIPKLQNGLSQLPTMNQNATTREVWLQWEETQSGQDRFYPNFVVVNQGDIVDLNFISNDTVTHDVIIGAPYNIVINASLPGLYNDLTGTQFTTPALHNSPGVKVWGRPGNVTAEYSFVAKYAGIYEFICSYHAQVGMFGYLVVLPNTAYAGAQEAGTTQLSVKPRTDMTRVDILSGAAADRNRSGFSPATVTVVIGVNNTVTWSNNDGTLHAFNALGGGFISGDVYPSQTFSWTFTTPGTYTYTCIFHPWMTGKVIVKAASGGNSAATTSHATSAGSPGSAKVTIGQGAGTNTSSIGYSSGKLVVVIGVNNTVSWTNDDSAPHTVTATDGSFDSGNISPGGTWSHIFTSPGTYTYTCQYHPWMKGEIIVESG